MRQRLPLPLKVLLVAGLLIFTGLVVFNALSYLSMEMDFAFLLEKGPTAKRPWWRLNFYLHVAGASLCLLCGPALFWNALLKKSRRLHRGIGWIYVVATLSWAAPSGFFLSIDAKGGAAGRLGFLLQATFWFAATLIGLGAIRSRDIPRHIAWMTRSYALAFSAISFRLFHMTFYAVGVGNDTNYLACIWLSFLSSLALGELCCPSLHKRPNNPFAFLKGA